MNHIKKNLPESPCYTMGRTPFISLYNRAGEAVALNQAHVDRINYSAVEGITLTNGKRRVSIRGCNLEPLFRAIASGEISQVRAVDPAQRLGLNADSWVEFVGKAGKPEETNKIGG